jgi:hypothetical protein
MLDGAKIKNLPLIITWLLCVGAVAATDSCIIGDTCTRTLFVYNRSVLSNAEHVNATVLYPNSTAYISISAINTSTGTYDINFTQIEPEGNWRIIWYVYNQTTIKQNAAESWLAIRTTVINNTVNITSSTEECKILVEPSLPKIDDYHSQVRLEVKNNEAFVVRLQPYITTLNDRLPNFGDIIFEKTELYILPGETEYFNMSYIDLKHRPAVNGLVKLALLSDDCKALYRDVDVSLSEKRGSINSNVGVYLLSSPSISAPEVKNWMVYTTYLMLFLLIGLIHIINMYKKSALRGTFAVIYMISLSVIISFASIYAWGAAT